MRCGYGGGDILHGVDVCVRRGEVLGVLGPNGCGKSTLVRALTGVLPLLGGEVRVGGRVLGEAERRTFAREVAVMSQFQGAPFAFTVREVVEMGRYPHVGSLEPLAVADREAVAWALSVADVAGLAGRALDTLSGGELQRVYFARTLAQGAGVLLLDEPVAHLDLGHQLRLFAVLGELAAERGVGVLCVLHDLNLAAAFCGRLMLMAEGRVVAEGGVEEVLSPERLERVYGVRVGMLRSGVSGRAVLDYGNAGGAFP